MTFSTPLRPLALAGLLAAAAIPASASAAGKPRPDLSVKSITSSPATVQTGARLTTTDTTRNGGRTRSKASTTAYFLSLDAKRSKADIRLGSRKVKALRAGRSSKAPATLTVTSLVPTGSYRLLACADAASKVKEKSERNNCRAARGRILVTKPPDLGTGAGPGTGTPGTGGTPDAGTGNSPAPPTLSIADGGATEGDSGITTAEFTVSLSGAHSAPVNVEFATVDDTATSPGDYAAQTGSLAFAPGETSKTITVDVSPEVVVEPAETFNVNLSAPTNATLADAQGVGTIGNDDVQATLRISEVNVNISGGDNLFELQVTSAGSVDGIFLRRNPNASGNVTLAALPSIKVAAGDLFILHIRPTAGTTELTSKSECTDPAPTCYSTAWDVSGVSGIGPSDRVYAVVAPGGIQDAVAVESNAASPLASFHTSLSSVQAAGLWLPADCGGNFCSGTSTPTAEEIAAETDGAGTTHTGASTQLTVEPGNQRSDWSVVLSTWGLLNAGL